MEMESYLGITETILCRNYAALCHAATPRAHPPTPHQPNCAVTHTHTHCKPRAQVEGFSHELVLRGGKGSDCNIREGKGGQKNLKEAKGGYRKLKKAKGG